MMYLVVWSGGYEPAQYWLTPRLADAEYMFDDYVKMADDGDTVELLKLVPPHTIEVLGEH
jgi:hypothetical protein